MNDERGTRSFGMDECIEERGIGGSFEMKE
jgi:hypothetical protein